MVRHAARALLLLFAGACSDESSGPDLDGRRFVLESAEGFELVDDTSVHLSFADGELSFSAGCNGYSGDYEIDGDHLIVGELGGTEKGCEPALHAQDQRLAEFFGADPSFELEADTLTLMNEDVTLTFLDREVAIPDRPLVGTTWTVDTFIEGDAASSLPSPRSPTIAFEADGSLELTAPCNNGTGHYAVNADRITLTEVESTLAFCPGAAGEVDNRFYAVMRDGTLSFTIDGQRLTLLRGELGLSARAP